VTPADWYRAEAEYWGALCRAVIPLFKRRDHRHTKRDPVLSEALYLNAKRAAHFAALLVQQEEQK